MPNGVLSIVPFAEPANRSKSGSSIPLNGYLGAGSRGAAPAFGVTLPSGISVSVPDGFVTDDLRRLLAVLEES